MEEIKFCKYCNKTKLKTDFQKHRAKCRSCRTIETNLWNVMNRSKHNAYQKKYKIKRYHEDLNFKLKVILRARLRRALKHDWKVGSSVKLLGCSIAALKIHIESKWQESMNWDNWAVDGWHIDHIVPLDYFDLSNVEELSRACHYTNLQPLWGKDNSVKSNKVE